MPPDAALVPHQSDEAAVAEEFSLSADETVRAAELRFLEALIEQRALDLESSIMSDSDEDDGGYIL